MFRNIRIAINSFKKRNYKIPSFDYDKDADVMYITFGEPKPCRTEEPESGLIIRYTVPNNELNGFTIINYSKRTNRSK